MSGTSGNAVALSRVRETFEGWRFPAFMLATLLFLTAMLLSALAIPPGAGALGAFAEDFRVWCFGFTSATGEPEWTYIVMMLVNPLMLAGVVLVVWWGPLKRAYETRPRGLWKTAGLALVVTVACGAGLVGMTAREVTATPVFDPVGLRTDIPAPHFTLTSQFGGQVSDGDFDGRIGVVTAVYANCPHTCPLILRQAQRVIDGLTPAERERVRVVGISLAPAHDTPEVLADVIDAHGLDTNVFTLATGRPATVNRVLDEFGVTRSHDSTMDVINHANLFFLIDQRGRVAYRFGLGALQEQWMGAALRHLIAEDGPHG